MHIMSYDVRMIPMNMTMLMKTRSSFMSGLNLRNRLIDQLINNLLNLRVYFLIRIFIELEFGFN